MTVQSSDKKSDTVDSVLINDWHPVAHIDTLEDGVPGSARLMEVDLVIWRSSTGVHVWKDQCAHRGTKLSLGSVCENRLVCAYHGWEYQADGACVRYPAHGHQKPSLRAKATTYAVEQKYGLIWVCLGTPANDIPPFPEIDDDTHRLYFGGQFCYNTSAQRGIENFLDFSHFPFVHAGYLGEQPHTEIKDYDIEVSETGLAVRNVKVWQPKPTNSIDCEGMEVDYEYYVNRPMTARLVKKMGIRNRDETEAVESIMLAMTPVEPDKAIAWALLASNYDDVLSDADVKAFTELIIGQDIRIVESQRPKLLPLKIRDEIHLQSDKSAVAYRRWLKSIGVTFGTTAG